MKYGYLLKIHLLLALLCVTSIEGSLEPLHAKASADDKMPSKICPLEESVMNSNESKNWHTVLNNFFCKFSEYKVQAAKRNFENNGIENLKKKDREIKQLIDEIQGKVIEKKNFETFLYKTVENNLTDYGSIKNIEINEIEIKELNHILNVTLRDKLQVDCEESHVYIKGHYVTTGDVINVLLSRTKLKDVKCKTVLLSDKTKFVSIFALNTFFIDYSINSSIIHSQNVVLMSIIAPKWENIGKNKIDLKGEDGGSPAAGSGMDGAPGKPGSPGGNFFGIGSEFINGVNLEISVDGGDGSRGHEGKTGRDGTDGETPTTPPSGEGGKRCHDRYCDGKQKLADYDCKYLDCFIEKRDISWDLSYKVYSKCLYVIFGRSGTKGQNGGKGGKGGKGGYPGKIQLIELKGHSQISLFKCVGQNGADGKGGAGGLGGRKGNDIYVRCRDTGLKWTYGGDDWELVGTKKISERAESGQKGLDGDNTRGMENPKLPIVINDLEKAKIINRYKNYLRENLNGKLPTVLTNDFLNHLENNINIKKLMAE